MYSGPPLPTHSSLPPPLSLYVISATIPGPTGPYVPPTGTFIEINFPGPTSNFHTFLCFEIKPENNWSRQYDMDIWFQLYHPDGWPTRAWTSTEEIYWAAEWMEMTALRCVKLIPHAEQLTSTVAMALAGVTPMPQNVVCWIQTMLCTTYLCHHNVVSIQRPTLQAQSQCTPSQFISLAASHPAPLGVAPWTPLIPSDEFVCSNSDIYECMLCEKWNIPACFTNVSLIHWLSVISLNQCDLSTATVVLFKGITSWYSMIHDTVLSHYKHWSGSMDRDLAVSEPQHAMAIDLGNFHCRDILTRRGTTPHIIFQHEIASWGQNIPQQNQF